MLTDPIAMAISEFLARIGLPIEESELDPGDCFLPGITVRGGRLVVDDARLEYPGDLLHEAGHLAVAPAEVRAKMGGGVDVPGVNMGALEVAAMAWSYAAALEIGLDPAVVFHAGGYHGKSEGLLRTYGYGGCPGAHHLQAAGLTADYPRMERWVR